VIRRVGAFVTLAMLLASLFVRLGFWQLDRLQQRRARNAVLAARLAESPLPIDELRDTAAFRRASVEGDPDYASEIVLTGRSRQGSPGVYIITPVRRAGSDAAVLVMRGWVYSPDAATVDLTRWHETRRSFNGYVLSLPAAVESPQQPAMGRKVRALTRERVRELVPYPVATRYLVSQDSVTAAAADSTPARVAEPMLDDGPHLSYAIQWFSFAAIALVGSYVIVRRSRAVGSTSAWRD
jgi:surfeit locus 1 family protein